MNSKKRNIIIGAIICVLLIIIVGAFIWHKKKEPTETNPVASLYFYKNNTASSYIVKKEKTEVKDYSYVNNYSCKKENCQARSVNSSEYFIIEDDKEFLYNMNSKEKHEVELGTISSNIMISLIFNHDKPTALVMENSNMEKKALYSITQNKYIYNFDELDIEVIYPLNNQNLVYYLEEKTSNNITSATFHFIEADTGKELEQIVETSASMKTPYLEIKANDKAHYFITSYYDGEKQIKHVYDQNFKSLNMEGMTSFEIDTTGNLIVSSLKTSYPHSKGYTNATQYFVYNQSGVQIKESKLYKDIQYLFGDYSLVINSANKLVLIDQDEKEVASITEWSSSHILDTYNCKVTDKAISFVWSDGKSSNATKVTYNLETKETSEEQTVLSELS